VKCVTGYRIAPACRFTEVTPLFSVTNSIFHDRDTAPHQHHEQSDVAGILFALVYPHSHVG
jgi:hypothetical protein